MRTEKNGKNGTSRQAQGRGSKASRRDSRRKNGEEERGPSARLRTGERGKIRVEISAGGIVYRRTPRGVRVALILDPYGKWTFAKGKQEKDESIEDTALRETREEMGLEDLRIVEPVGMIDIWFRERFRPELKGVLVHKYVHYFLMETLPDAKGKPMKKEHIRRIIWVGLGRLTAQSGYKDVKLVVAKAKAILGGKSGGGSEGSGTPPLLFHQRGRGPASTGGRSERGERKSKKRGGPGTRASAPRTSRSAAVVRERRGSAPEQSRTSASSPTHHAKDN